VEQREKEITGEERERQEQRERQKQRERQGARMTLGVRPRPFMARAWVEVEGCVVNDLPLCSDKKQSDAGNDSAPYREEGR